MKAARPLTLGALVMASVTVAVGLLEIGIRAADGVFGGGPPGVVDSPKALHRQTPAGKRITPDLDVVIERHPTSQLRTHVRTNHLGLRGPEVPAREVGELRVLVLGDSITFGDYVDEDETYPAALERHLQAAMPARVVRVINGGGPNVGTMDEAALLADLAPELRPDLVVVGFYLNDSVGQAPYPSRTGFPRGSGGAAWPSARRARGRAWSTTPSSARATSGSTSSSRADGWTTWRPTIAS